MVMETPTFWKNPNCNKKFLHSNRVNFLKFWYRGLSPKCNRNNFIAKTRHWMWVMNSTSDTSFSQKSLVHDCCHTYRLWHSYLMAFCFCQLTTSVTPAKMTVTALEMIVVSMVTANYSPPFFCPLPQTESQGRGITQVWCNSSQNGNTGGRNCA